MTEQAGTPLTAYDHTDLRDRPKRLWSWGDIPLPGLSLPALGAAVACALVTYLALTAISTAVPLLRMSVWMVPVYFCPAFGLYFLWGRPLASQMTFSQQLVVWCDFLFVQPRRIRGLGADSEPDEVNWTVILWRPTDQRWHQRREALVSLGAGGRGV